MASLRQARAWLGDLTLAGVHTALRRARIVWKRARASIRSPAPDDDAQWADVVAAVGAAQAQPGRVITVYLDEVTVERQPTVASAYAPTGSSEQARAVRSLKSNVVTRILGAWNALTGGVSHASWCNPIEKLWRKLRQDVIHLHRWADDPEALRAEIDRCLDQFAKDFAELLRYVGLATPD